MNKDLASQKHGMLDTSLAVILSDRDSPVPVSSKTPLFFRVRNQTSLNYLLLIFLE